MRVVADGCHVLITVGVADGETKRPRQDRDVCNDKPDGDARRCYPSDLSDAGWAVLQPLMPVRDARKGGARRRYDDRLVLDAIFFVLRSGCQWRMIPRDLLPWDAAYRWYRHWRRDGTWDRVHDTLRDLVRAADGRDPEPSAAVLDAQSIVSGEGGQARGFDMAKRTRGRKRHLVVDTLGLVLVVTATSAAVQDRPGGRAILARLAAVFPTVGLVWADGGYANRIDNSLPAWAAAKLRLVVPIVKRSDDVKASRCCRAAGSWSARSAGWSATVASPATTNA